MTKTHPQLVAHSSRSALTEDIVASVQLCDLAALALLLRMLRQHRRSELVFLLHSLSRQLLLRLRLQCTCHCEHMPSNSCSSLNCVRGEARALRLARCMPLCMRHQRTSRASTKDGNTQRDRTQ